MSTGGQMVALLHKDLIIMKRSKCRTCCELTIPLIFLPFIILSLWASYKIDRFGSYKDFNESLSSVELRSLTHYQIIVQNHEWYETLKSKSGSDIELGEETSSSNKKSPYIEFLEFDPPNQKFKYVISENYYSQSISIGWVDPFNEQINFLPESDLPLNTQRSVDELLLRIIGKSGATTEKLSVANFKHPSAWKNLFNSYILPYFSILIVFVSLIPIANAAKGIIIEVESEIKIYLMVLGMSRVSYYFSHLVNNTLKLLIIIFIFMFPCVFFLHGFTAFVLYGLVFLFTICIVSYALLWATIIHRPGVCMAVIILTTLLLLVISYVMPDSRLDVGLMCLGALNPVHSLTMGFKDLSFYDQFNQKWPNQRIFYQFNAFLSAIFLCIDIVLIVLITLLLDLMIPSAGQTGLSFASLFRRKVQDVDRHGSIHKEDFEASKRVDANTGIKVANLVKRWDTGEYAVNKISFSAHKNEITCLLGHNGAGKSTTFSCLTGYIKPTSGDLLVCGLDIRTHLTKCRKFIGFCPQTNPLYNQLTCSEHLRLAAKLRGTYQGDQDVFEVLNTVGLGHAINVEAAKLSGGMKRKLSVALALIGKSQVVLLDEPTAGMDPTARKQIADILDKYKKERTIILTTHYMDEADQLGDKIIIMVKGKIACAGSSNFLKKRFGTGFLLTITMNTNVPNVEASSQKILDRIQFYIPEAKFEGSPAVQFTVNMPYESKTRFTEVFSMLEDENVELEIDTFGLSVNTLEQVFIKVGEKAEGVESQELRKKVMANADIIREGDENSNPNFFLKFFALFVRNFTYWIRNPIRSSVPFVVMLLCFGLLIIFQNTGKKDNDITSNFNLDKKKINFHLLRDLPKSKILTDKAHSDSVSKLFHSLNQCKISTVNSFNTDEYSFDVPPPSLGISDSDSGGISTYTNRFLQNGRILALNLYSNLKAGSLNAITVGLETNVDIDFSVLKTLLLSDLIKSLCVVAGVSYGLSILLSEVITERVKKFKYQLYLAGANPILYWGTQLVTDFCYIFVLVIVITVGASVVAKLQAACVVGASSVWLLYFFTASVGSYVLSFLFSSPTKASVFTLAFHTVIPLVIYILLTIAIFVIYILAKFDNKGDIIDPNVLGVLRLILGCFFPGFALFNAQNYIFQTCKRNDASFTSAYKQYNDPTSISLKDESEKTLLDIDLVISLISLVVGFIFYVVLLILLELRVFSRLFGNGKSQSDISFNSSQLDHDVQQEVRRVAQIPDQQLPLVCRDLYKYYGSKCALKGLTFGINKSECFGLLGINGAGKTTTFDILSNTIKASSGYASIEGVNAEKNPLIGYCPQFDALSDVLTANDILFLIGRLNGFVNLEERVNLVLQCVMMTEHANKLVKECSGGQKRRISIAVSLMSGATFLMLDEPTAGVDPGTRRTLWDLLTAMRKQNKSILLTTHSMEECEALCNKVGFLRAGTLEGIGTTQHLKSRYGNSYILTFVQSIPSQQSGEILDAEVQRKFSCEKTQESYHLSSLSWVIPRRSELKWSQMYGQIEDFVNQINRHHNSPIVQDFFLIQNSLEQVFTRLAQNEEASHRNSIDLTNTQVNNNNTAPIVNQVAIPIQTTETPWGLPNSTTANNQTKF